MRLPAFLGELPSTYWYLWVGTLINRTGGFVVPFLALYLTQQRSLSVAEAGGVVSLFGLGGLAAGPVAGAMCDRIGRRATLLFGLVAGSVAMLLMGLADDVVSISIMAVVLGFLMDIHRPAVSAMMADVVPPEHRVRAFGLLYWAVNLGFSLASVIAGYMATRSYLALFIGDAVTTLVYAVIVLKKVPETRPVTMSSTPGATGSLMDVFRDSVFMPYAFLGFLLAVIFQQTHVGLAVDMKQKGLPESDYGLVIALNGVLIVLLQPLASSLLTPWRRARTLATASILTGLGLSFNLWATDAPGFAIGIAVLTLGEIAQATIGPSIVVDLAPVAMRGRYSGAHTMSFAAGGFVGPSLGALVMGTFGSSTLWAGCLALGALVAVAHLVIERPRTERLKQLQAQGQTPSRLD